VVKVETFQSGQRAEQRRSFS
jgi:mRNA (guanine-N7-)-methyltransferase